jgi:phage baseplate assembly protein gpV
MSANGNGASGVSRLTNGVVIGVVIDLDDPEGEGRIKVSFPWLGEGESSAWAPVAASFAGSNRGSFFAPEPDDEALVCFEHGDFNHPFIVGFLWNGADSPPSQDPRCRIIRSLNGHEIALHDPDVLAGDQGHVRVTHASGDEIRITNTGITITSRASIVIQAPSVSINGRPVVPTPQPI